MNWVQKIRDTRFLREFPRYTDFKGILFRFFAGGFIQEPQNAHIIVLYLERNTYINKTISFLGDGTVCTGGEKDRKLLTWDSAREFEKRLEIKLPDGVGSARSLTKQTIDQVSI